MYILQLNDDHQGAWLELDETGRVLSQQTIAELSECPKIETDAKLTVLIPGAWVRMTTLKLPKMRESERIKAIPFALEEQLATEPDGIFFVSAESKHDDALDVAVIEETLLSSLMTKINAADLHPQVLLPDFLSLAIEADAWSVLIENNMALIRLDEHRGFSIDRANLLLFLQLLLEKNKKPDRIVCFQKKEVVDVTAFEKLNVPVFVRDIENQVFFDVKNFGVNAPMNFLTRKYKPKLESSLLEKKWKVCAASAGLWIVILFLSQIGQWFYFHHQSTKLEKQVLSAYQVLFPGAKDVLEPHYRTAHLLSAFKAASHGSVFLKLLSAAGETVGGFPDIQISLIHFEKESLVLTVRAQTLVQLSQWSQAMRGHAVLVQQHVLSTDKSGVNAEMTIKGVA